MKQQWTKDELEEHWTLAPEELGLLKHKSGKRRLSFCLMLKFFQFLHRFPTPEDNIPSAVVDHMSSQTGVESSGFSSNHFSGETAGIHRDEIRGFLGVRKHSMKDSGDLIEWLIAEVLPEGNCSPGHLTTRSYERFKELRVEPFSPDRVGRNIRSALSQFESRFFAAINGKIGDAGKRLLDELVEEDTGHEPEDEPDAVGLADIREGSGGINLKSILAETRKLERVQMIGLPSDLFAGVSPRILKRYSARVSAEPPNEIRAHHHSLRRAMLAVHCHLARMRITDDLVELLIQIVHKIGARAETLVDDELVKEAKGVENKPRILYDIARSALASLGGVVREVIFPVVDERKLQAIVTDFAERGGYQKRVQERMRLSFGHYYRRMLAPILRVLVFRSNSAERQPVIDALRLMREFVDSSLVYYPCGVEVPVSGVAENASWEEFMLEKGGGADRRVNRINYEIAVLRSLRDGLRCKEIWVEGADEYRDPDEDLPADFDRRREEYYKALDKPLDAEEFISNLKNEMRAGLKRVSSGNADVDYQALRYVRRRFIDADRVRSAIVKVVDAIFDARTESVWGEATTACAGDSTKFGSWDQNLMTEWHVRYRGPGVMIYWHVERKSACIHSQLKRCSSSEVAAMIGGVLRHCTSMEVESAYVDTHGQSVIGFAFAHMLCFDLLPRLKAIHRQKLFRPDAGGGYANLKEVMRGVINWDLIREQYDPIVRYTTALRLGTAEPEAILRRFTRGNARHPVYKALTELGKARKTIFLCRYLHSEELRREINEGLNVIENWNSGNALIFYGKSGEFSSNRRDEQEMSMLCLHLLQVAIVYVNTLMIQSILARPEWRGRLTDEDRRALCPLLFEHIQPYGLFPLDLNTRMSIEEDAA